MIKSMYIYRESEHLNSYKGTSSVHPVRQCPCLHLPQGERRCSDWVKFSSLLGKRPKEWHDQTAQSNSSVATTVYDIFFPHHCSGEMQIAVTMSVSMEPKWEATFKS